MLSSEILCIKSTHPEKDFAPEVRIYTFLTSTERTKTMNDNPAVAVDLKNDLIPQLKTISAGESKLSSLALLLVTVVIFFSAGIVTARWQDIVVLIGVLLFHELGHLVAMKSLKYSDVKMFFIPFLGAAVSGKSLNDTATKSCVVSLMGPFPGIVAGVLLYFLFLMTQNYYVYKTAQVMLVLNALNFLPIMPLDGGRYIDVLFINRRYFRLFFALIGAIIFFLLAAAAKDIFIALLGLFTVYMALANFKLHGVSVDLKAEGIGAASVKDLLEDETALQAVVDKLRVRYPKLFSPQINYRGIFNQLTVIVDTIKFVPARLWSKTVLLMLYLVLLVASILVVFLFVMSNYREMPRTETINGKEVIFVERHAFGRKNIVCPVDEALRYHGKGTVFGFDGRITGTFYYENGYRTGEWQDLDNTGTLIKKKTYDRGKLLSVSQLENGQWKTRAYEDLSFPKKCFEEIQRISQPYKTNYKYFQN